jgi:hypothetical protein
MNGAPARIGAVCAGAFLLLVGGCLELVPVAPPAQEASVLAVNLQLAADAPGSPAESVPVRVHVSLSLGIDGAGRDHELERDTIGVWDRGLPLARSIPSGPFAFIETVRIPGERIWGEAITVEPPAVVGLPSEPFSLEWPRFRRLDPDTVWVEPGADVEIRLAMEPPTAATPAPEWRWAATLASTGRWLSFGENAPPPALIRIPAELLPPEGGVYGVVVFVDQAANRTLAPGGYRARVTVQQQIRWTVATRPPGG